MTPVNPMSRLESGTPSNVPEVNVLHRSFRRDTESGRWGAGTNNYWFSLPDQTFHREASSDHLQVPKDYKSRNIFSRHVKGTDSVTVVQWCLDHRRSLCTNNRIATLSVFRLRPE